MRCTISVVSFLLLMATTINAQVSPSEKQRAITEIGFDIAKSLAERDYGKVVALAKKAIAIDPGSAVWHGAKGTGLVRLQQYREAIEAYNTALRINSNNPDFRMGRANAFSAVLECRSAISDYNEVLTREKSAEGFASRAFVKERSGDWVGALADVQTASALEPSNASFLAQAARIELRRGNKAVSRSLTKQALAMDRSESIALVVMKWLETGDTPPMRRCTDGATAQSEPTLSPEGAQKLPPERVTNTGVGPL